MLKRKKWLLVTAGSLTLVSAITWSNGFLNKATAEHSESKIELQLSEQIAEEELKQAALKETDSKTAYEQFTAMFAAYKEMHLKNSIYYANKKTRENKSYPTAFYEIEKKAELIAHFELELENDTKTGEQLLTEFLAATEELNRELNSNT